VCRVSSGRPSRIEGGAMEEATGGHVLCYCGGRRQAAGRPPAR